MANTKEKSKPRLCEVYEKEIRPRLQKALGYTNVNQVPQLEKIVVSMGVGAATQDQAIIQDSAHDLALITGQKPLVVKARKSVSNFKLREGQGIGCKVTLRGAHMYDFIERLLCVALPRIRDFRGVSAKAFDGRGNYSLGLTEQVIFPEIDPDKVKRIQGMNIAFVTTALTDEAGAALLREFGMPFSK